MTGPISPGEYAARLAALGRLTRDSDLDAYVVSSRDSIFYLTGASYEPLERPFFIVVRPERAPELLVPLLEAAHLCKAAGIGEIHAYPEFPARPGRDWASILVGLLDGARAVGVEESLPCGQHGALAELSPRALALVEELRLIKSRAEVEALRRAARYADLCTERLLAVAGDGVPVAAGFGESRTVMGKLLGELGGDYSPMTSHVTMATWPAPLSAQPHAIPGIADRLGAGPQVALALARVTGYSAECERTHFVVQPDRTQAALFETMMEARRLAFDRVRPGVRASELDAEVNDFLRGEGHGEHLLHRTGHGFGLGGHERPWLAEGSDDVLQENMLISIEPGIYIDEIGGFRHSDTVLVTADGHECLTRYPSDLASLDLSRLS
jgi:Xaa-Pro aminopeptidase